MKDYRRGSHSIFQLHVHLVWCTKYRKDVLRKDVGKRLRDLSRQICSDMGGWDTVRSSRRRSRASSGINSPPGIG